MLHLTGDKLYFATKSLQTACVFSSDQKALTAGYDSIIEIEPYLLDGSPVCDGYVFCAKGTSIMLCRDGGSPSSQRFSLGPVWGVNPQSAVGALCEAGCKRKNVLTDTLCLFRIDQEYTAAELINLRSLQPFTALTQRIYDWNELPEETRSADYTGRYFELKRETAERRRQEAERRQRESSLQMHRLCESMLCLLRQHASDSDKAYANTSDPSLLHAQFKQALSYKLTQEELDRLTESLSSILSAQTFIPDDPFAADDTKLLCKAYDACLRELWMLRNPHSKYRRLIRYLD